MDEQRTAHRGALARRCALGRHGRAAGRRLRPGDRARSPARVDFASAGRRRRGGRRRRRRPAAEWRRGVAGPAHRRCCSRSASCSHAAQGRAGRDRSPPSTARCSPTRSARCSAASRSSSSPAGSRTCSRAASPRASRPASTSYSIRQPLGVVAVISPFNFPAMVPMWFFPIAIACGNAVVLKPSEKDPSAVDWLAELWAEAGLPDGRLQRRARRQGGGRRAAGRTPTSRRSRSSARPRSRGTSTRPAPAHGKRVQALGGAKNHMVVLPGRRPRPGRRRRGQRRLRLGGRALHGDLGAGRGRARSPTSWSRKIADADGAAAHRGRRDAAATWARWSPARTATRWRRYVDAGVDAGAELVVDGRDVRAGRRRRRLLARPDAVRPRDARRCRSTPTRSSGRCSRWCASASYDEALALVNANPYGNGTAIFTNDGGRGAALPARGRGRAWSASTCRSRCRWRTTRSAAGRPRCSATPTPTATEGVHFFTRGKVVTSRWPAPGRGVLGGPDAVPGETQTAPRRPGASTCSSPPTSSRVGADVRVSRAESAQMCG